MKKVIIGLTVLLLITGCSVTQRVHTLAPYWQEQLVWQETIIQPGYQIELAVDNQTLIEEESSLFGFTEVRQPLVQTQPKPLVLNMVLHSERALTWKWDRVKACSAGTCVAASNIRPWLTSLRESCQIKRMTQQTIYLPQNTQTCWQLEFPLSASLYDSYELVISGMKTNTIPHQDLQLALKPHQYEVFQTN